MKKIIMVFVLLIGCLTGCQKEVFQLKETDYFSEENQQYENGKSSMNYDGEYFNAKLMKIKRYVLKDGRFNYEYQLYIKPKVRITSKNLYVQVLKTSILKEYYAGKEKQRGYDEVVVPIQLKEDQTHCYELNYNILSNDLSEIGEQNWNHEMNSVQVQLKWGTHKEIITFYESVNVTYAMSDKTSQIKCSVIR
ncbi:MAG: hypothetical protein RR524_05890 [Erysipelotrichaceae bacterium]